MRNEKLVMGRKLIFRLFAAFVSWHCANTVAGQVMNEDSVHSHQRIEIIKRSADSLQVRYQDNLNKLDSLESRFEENGMVHASNRKIDSIQSLFHQRVDSLDNGYKKRLSYLDSSQAFLQKKLDSLTTFKLPTVKISARLDSLNELRRK